MQFSTTTALGYLAAAASTVSAQTGTTLKVSVGDGALVFSPNNLQNVAPGTAVEFTFFPKNHTVSQSSFADPCHPLNGNAGFFSGFVPTPSPVGSTFTIIVPDTKPIWIYCGQTVGNHCQSGMTAAINAPATGNNTFANFQALAAKASTSTNLASGPVGGVLVNKNANNSSTGVSSSTSSVETVVTTSAVSTIATVVTSGSSTFTSTYSTDFATTYTTEVPAAATGSGSGSGSGSATTSSVSSVPTGAANKIMVGAGAAGAAVMAVIAML